MRREHAARVRSALDPTISAAEERAHASLLEALAAIGTIAEADQALRHVGAEGFWLGAADLEGLLFRLARLAGKG